MYGVFSAARDGRERFDGASGTADLTTGRPARADLRHRVGSVTKTFTAVAVLQQNAKGRVDLDRPVGDYVPDLLPGERGRKVTVRMLLNHTSGIEDYIADAFSSLRQGLHHESGRPPLPHDPAHRADRLRGGPPAAVRTGHRLELLQHQLHPAG
ncbi:serine hydrolase domain-containing protein [Streptomyces virginiae]|uniref:serine hydrolase domain-containing protein n=1 Tax=Streptomyces virginiae TaxID=1961 RepID=UPI0036A49FBB